MPTPPGSLRVRPNHINFIQNSDSYKTFSPSLLALVDVCLKYNKELPYMDLLITMGKMSEKFFSPNQLFINSFRGLQNPEPARILLGKFLDLFSHMQSTSSINEKEFNAICKAFSDLVGPPNLLGSLQGQSVPDRLNRLVLALKSFLDAGPQALNKFQGYLWPVKDFSHLESTRSDVSLVRSKTVSILFEDAYSEDIAKRDVSRHRLQSNAPVFWRPIIHGLLQESYQASVVEYSGMEGTKSYLCVSKGTDGVYLYPVKLSEGKIIISSIDRLMPEKRYSIENNRLMSVDLNKLPDVNALPFDINMIAR